MSGNFGEKVDDINYATTDVAREMAAYDRLPKRLRAVIRNLSANWATSSVLEARSTLTDRQIEITMLLEDRKFIENANREKE